MPHVARIALHDERALRRPFGRAIEQRQEGRGILVQRLAAQPQRTVRFALDVRQVDAPSSTVPLIR